MKQFKVMVAAALVGLVMASCAKDNEISKDDTLTGKTSVKIQLVYGHTDTRADGAAIADKTNLDFTEGHIFFATSSGTIDKHIGVGNSAGSIQVSKTDLKGGEVVVEGLSGSATRCYILFTDVNAKIGSSTGITGDLRGKDISTIKSMVIPVGNINDASGAVANVPLYGEGVVEVVSPDKTSGGSDYNAKVSVTINSLAARLQIGKISAKVYNYTNDSGNQTVTIDAFTVGGIYINNFHQDMTVGSTAGTIIDGADNAGKYSTAAGTSYATGGIGEKLCDVLKTAATGSPLAVAANGVWAYNLFPTTVPHIIIELTNVKYTDSATGTQITIPSQFIAVQSFKYAPGHANAGEVVTNFAANNIYTLSDIQFNFTNMVHSPYEKTMDVLVEVQMMKWLNNGIVWNN